jgi:hypothetical protein
LAGQAADQLTLVSGAPQFADHFIALGNVEVEGVENRELFDQQHRDVRAFALAWDHAPLSPLRPRAVSLLHRQPFP